VTADTAAAHEQDDARYRDRDRAVQRQPPRERDDPVRVRGCDEEGEARDATERVADRRRRIAVPRREGAGGERREQLEECGRDQPRQGVGRHDRGDVRQPPRHELAEEAGESHGHERRGDGDDEERHAVGPELGAEPTLLLGAREIRDDDHPECLGPEHQHEVDAICGHEPVRPQIPPELVRQERAGQGGREAQRDI
jgi:hypothetical protein